MPESPFDLTGVARDARGVAQYVDLPPEAVTMLRASVERAPDDLAAQELDGPSATYRELWDRASRIAGGMHAGGVVPGDRVAIRLPNGLDWVLALWGTLLAGAVAVPVNTRFTDDEVAYVVADSGAAITIDAATGLPDGEPYTVVGLGPENLAAIFYTSGTTGAPKGAMITHANMMSNAETSRRVIGLPPYSPDMRNLISVPLFHVTGCLSQLVPTLRQGGTAVIMPEFHVHRFLRALADDGINRLTSVPAIYWLALQQPEFADLDTSGVLNLSYGGAPIAPSLVHALREAFPQARVGNGFGLSETSSISTFLPHEDAEAYADSVGYPAPVVDLDLLDPDPASGIGELLVRGGNVAAGYWGKPEATAETFVDGWLHTGDLARIDEAGRVFLVDRAKDMINRGGENVYSVEVENALAGAPGVGEVAVVAVPDEMMGEKVGAVVVPAGDFEAGAFLAYAAEKLADFKVPQYLATRAEPLPRNAGGKVLKKQLRAETTWGAPLR